MNDQPNDQVNDEVASQPQPHREPQRRLYRAAHDRKLAGVCGGVAEYIGLDPTIVRLAVVVFTLFNPTTLLAYLIAAFVIPERPSPVHAA